MVRTSINEHNVLCFVAWPISSILWKNKIKIFISKENGNHLFKMVFKFARYFCFQIAEVLLYMSFNFIFSLK